MNNETPHRDHNAQHSFKFTGRSGEFFGIWFVNLLLTILTLGLYSPWAKVRTLQYFYSNTNLADSHFHFLAKPGELFKSRLIAIALFLPFIVAQSLSELYLWATILYGVMIVTYLVILPVILVLVMSFRLRYSAWRGVAFQFNKDYKGSYRVYLAPILVIALIIASITIPIYIAEQSETKQSISEQSITEQLPMDSSIILEPNTEQASPKDANPTEDSLLDIDVLNEDKADTNQLDPLQFIPAAVFTIMYFLLLPYFSFISTRFLARNARFGTSKLKFLASAKDFYVVYSKALAGIVMMAVTWFVVIRFSGAGLEVTTNSSTGLPDGLGSAYAVLIAVTILGLYLLVAYMTSRKYNLLFNNIEIGDGHRLHANASFLGYFWLMVSNSIGIIVSLGFLRAWAMIRTARFYLDCTELAANGSLDEFIAAETQKVNALAEEGADIFDMDLI